MMRVLIEQGEIAIQALALATPDNLRLLPPETISLLPTAFLDTLDPSLRAELDELAADFGGAGATYIAEFEATPTAEPTPVAEATEEGEETTADDLPQVEPIGLPESWIGAAAEVGQTITTTADIDATLMGGIVGFAPQLLADLAPKMWRALDPAALALALPVVEDELDESLLAQLQAIVAAGTGQEPEPVALPDSWITAGTAAGFPISTTAGIDATTMQGLAGFAPQLLEDLTPEVLLAFTPTTLAALPPDYVAGLDLELQETLTAINARHAQFLAASEPATEEEEGETAGATPEPKPTDDPARLPDTIIQAMSQFGLDIEYAYEIDPALIRQLSAAGPQAAQFLALLTPGNLRALQPEAIALLPMDFVETLDADLRAELDELAAEFGGAGQLAVQEATEAAEEEVDTTGSPALSGPWIEPGPDGTDPLFLTAGDILNNDFTASDPTPAAALLNFFPNSPQVQDPVAWMSALTPEVLQYLAENEEGFVEALSPTILEMMSPETLTFLLETYPDAFDAETTGRLQAIAAGTATVFVPESSITRTDGNPSLLIDIYKDGDANTVVVAHRIFDRLAEYTAENPDLEVSYVFEQASFIEESIEGVSREGLLGAVFAVIIILIFLSGHVRGRYQLSWRSTVVTAVSIPLSVLIALVLMRWVPPTLGEWLHNLATSTENGVLRFISQLFPTSITLNIMTLSGMTVAVGRVVDDSIVVLENIYRHIQRGDEPRTAVINGTREVAIAIFASTATTVAVFLPLGLIGGIIGSFFLPFGLTVTYALAASFLVAITVVPMLAFLLIRKEHLPEEKETTMQRWYTPALVWSLRNRLATLVIAGLIFAGSILLLLQLPQSFIPSLGEPTINVQVSLPGETRMAETDALVRDFEDAIAEIEGIERVQVLIGSGGGFAAFFGGGSISQNAAGITISIEDQEQLVNLTNDVRQEAVAAFGEENVTVSGASQTGFSGFSIILTGDSAEELQAAVPDVKEALGSVDIDNNGRPEIANVSSNVDDAAAGGASSIIRIDGRPAISFSGELETENTLGVTAAAKEAVASLESLPAGVEVTEGFDTQQQTEGFRNMLIAILYSIGIVYLIMALTFRSIVHPFTILFSLPFALVGAAVALYITDSVLGISAMIGLMMLVGVVVTNAIVLMEMVQQLRHQGANAYDALVQAGRTRLRPIWMTALAAILALIPLAASQEGGAIIAAELATVVIGGLLVSTLLTLLVVPVVYSLLDQLGRRIGLGRAAVEG
jgi:HAE1 family hydrophobic/amphiphilic exporter-1